MPKKSWAEKFESAKPPVVKRLDKNVAGMKAGQMMLIPSPKLIDDYIRSIPEGTSSDLSEMREELANQEGAETTCPITSGIFLRIVAERMWDQNEQGAAMDELTPVWRVINTKTPTFKKLSFDGEFLIDQRRREGLGE